MALLCEKRSHAHQRRLGAPMKITSEPGGDMQINIPEVVAEVRNAFIEYERALSTNDLDAMDGLFWKSSVTLRYGPNGTLVGHDAISAFRRARNIKGINRTLKNTFITTFGRDFAVTNTESESIWCDQSSKPDLGSNARRLANCFSARVGSA
jgi:AtzH-like